MASPNTTFTSGAILTAAQMNNLPFGLCGLQTLNSRYASSAPNTTFQDTGATLTVTEVSGRRYKITMLSNPYPSAGLQGIRFALIRGASTLREWTYSSAVLDTGVALGVAMTYVYTSVGSGNATYKMQIAAATSNTTVDDFGDATFPRQFIIEDLGPA